MKNFNENRNAFPQEELAKYYGKYVAWSDDGKRILASADEEQEVYEKIKAAGYDLEHVVFSYVPLPNEVFWGGGLSVIMEEISPVPVVKGKAMPANEYLKNRNQFLVDELAKYEGQHVAWSVDGKRILASDKDPLAMIAKLQAAGFTSDDCVLSFVELDS